MESEMRERMNHTADRPRVGGRSAYSGGWKRLTTIDHNARGGHPSWRVSAEFNDAAGNGKRYLD